MFKSVKAEHLAHPDAVAVVAFSDEGVSVASLPEVQEAARRPEWKADVGQILEAFPIDSPRIFLLGLGKQTDLTSNVIRKVAASLARACARAKIANLHLDFTNELGTSEQGQSFGEAFGLFGWTSGQFRGTIKDERLDLSVAALNGEFDRGFQRGLALATSQNFARTLANTPPNIATPEWIASQAQSLGREVGLEVTVIRYPDLKQNELHGIDLVGRASENNPCFVRLAYTPPGTKASDKPLVLIGKTITYDTGGLSLKVNNGMLGMKHDKCGGCAVLGAMHAIATVVKPQAPVVALLSVAENSVSSQAYRPDDVVTYMNGVTVEITNTDAEGRLVLADALCWAYAKENPSAVIDMATLTGGVVIALGNIRAGLFAEDSALRTTIESAGEATGEKVWHLPLDAEYDEMMKSPVADLVNSSPKKIAHPITGAVFLRKFTKTDAPWAHIDIAGVASSDADAGLYTQGATGFGARLMAKVVETWSKSGATN